MGPLGVSLGVLDLDGQLRGERLEADVERAVLDAERLDQRHGAAGDDVLHGPRRRDGEWDAPIREPALVGSEPR